MKAMFVVAFLAMIAVAYGGYIAAPVYGGYGVGYGAPVASYSYGIGSYAAPVAYSTYGSYGGYGLSAPYYGYGLGYGGLGLLKK